MRRRMRIFVPINIFAQLHLLRQNSRISATLRSKNHYSAPYIKGLWQLGRHGSEQFFLNLDSSQVFKSEI